MSFSTVHMPKNIFYGEDAFTKVGDEAASLGKKALIISDHMMDKLGNVNACESFLQAADLAHAKYLDIDSEPTDQFVYEALDLFKAEACDVIIALGGGSCIDTAKAVAVLATNGGEIGDYMNNKVIASKKAIPLIAVPTTAGTGSEATDVTVITHLQSDVKMMIKQPAFLPETAIVDPNLSVPSPKKVTAATGVDALTHAIEAYISKLAQPFTNNLALSAISLIAKNIRIAYQDGENIEARENMAYGAMLAGMAFSNASVCLVHGMSRPIGAIFHVPHGESNAMLLPAVLEFNKDVATDRLVDIGHVLFDGLEGLTNPEIADRVVLEVKQLCCDLNIPNMKACGIDQDKLQQVQEKMAKDAIISGSPGNNPRVPTEEEIVGLYQICYDYNFSNNTVVSR